MSIETETAANFQAFYEAWTSQAVHNWTALHTEDNYLASYRRIAAFQALKLDILCQKMPAQSLAFVQEAHNDALVSHVSASYGAWRLALKSLRSVIENTLAALYYADHAVELKNWQRGRRRTTFTELYKYFEDHPDLEGIATNVSGLDRIKSEYATLSKAVHASATVFRMTDNVSQVMLWSTTKERLGKWSTRERETLTGVSQLVVALHKDEFTGAQRSQLREILGFLFGSSIRSEMKNNFKITIPAPK